MPESLDAGGALNWPIKDNPRAPATLGRGSYLIQSVSGRLDKAPLLPGTRPKTSLSPGHSRNLSRPFLSTFQ
jgi:hypothetical protein